MPSGTIIHWCSTWRASKGLSMMLKHRNLKGFINWCIASSYPQQPSIEGFWPVPSCFFLLFCKSHNMVPQWCTSKLLLLLVYIGSVADGAYSKQIARRMLPTHIPTSLVISNNLHTNIVVLCNYIFYLLVLSPQNQYSIHIQLSSTSFPLWEHCSTSKPRVVTCETKMGLESWLFNTVFLYSHCQNVDQALMHKV